MANKVLSQDDSARSEPDAEPTDSATPCERSTKEPLGVAVVGPIFLLVQRRPDTENPDALERPVLLTANQDGLNSLGNFDRVQSIWIVRMSREGLVTTECVSHLCHWRLFPGPEDMYVTALLCESGSIFIVSDDSVFQVDEVTRKWFAGGRFATSRRLHDVFAIETTVVGRLNSLDVVTVQSDEGLYYSITRHTVGVTLETLHEGMRVECLVSRLQRVLSASVLGHVIYAAEA